ncbi:MAG: hypothetical protein ACK2UO_09095, partial [Caldilineaceae bacterium]
MLDRRGILSFVLITFFVTYAIEGVLFAAGVSFVGMPSMLGQLVVAAVMWVPALGTVLTIKFVTKEGWSKTNLRFGAWRPYVSAALLVPAVFAVIYGISWALGLCEPDWQLTQF